MNLFSGGVETGFIIGGLIGFVIVVAAVLITDMLDN